VSGRKPGFVDEAEGPRVAEAPLRPVLLEPLPGAPSVIEPDWAPGAVRAAAGRSGLAWLVGGVALLLLGWVGLSAVELAWAAFDRVPAWGWVATAVLGAAAGMIGWALSAEWRAWRALARMDRLRALLEGSELEPARAAALGWVGQVAARLREPAAARAALGGAGSVVELRAALQLHVAGPLAEASGQAGQRAALQAGALVALAPHPALDALLAGWRGVRLVREVAAIHGLRPGAVASWALARRVVATAAGTAGMELLTQGLSDQLLQHMPVLRHVAGAVPGATLAAVRLYRLARVTAVACSPLTRPGDL
jgi:putative membrane protein